jgi:hypothetical protein
VKQVKNGESCGRFHENHGKFSDEVVSCEIHEAVLPAEPQVPNQTADGPGVSRTSADLVLLRLLPAKSYKNENRIRHFHVCVLVLDLFVWLHQRCRGGTSGRKPQPSVDTCFGIELCYCDGGSSYIVHVEPKQVHCNDQRFPIYARAQERIGDGHHSKKVLEIVEIVQNLGDALRLNYDDIERDGIETVQINRPSHLWSDGRWTNFLHSVADQCNSNVLVVRTYPSLWLDADFLSHTSGGKHETVVWRSEELYKQRCGLDQSKKLQKVSKISFKNYQVRKKSQEFSKPKINFEHFNSGVKSIKESFRFYLLARICGIYVILTFSFYILLNVSL